MKKRRNFILKEKNTLVGGVRIIQKKTHLYYLNQRIRNPERLALSRKKYKLKSKYGLTVEQFENMRSIQNNLCAICENDFTLKKPACVDHNHNTGKIRGLLHHSCNLILGNSGEDIAILQRAINYIKSHIPVINRADS
jgi:hypothetical protein